MLNWGALWGLIALLGWGSSDFYAGRLSRKIGNLWAAFWVYTFSLLFTVIYVVVNPAQLSEIGVNNYLNLSLAAILQAFAAFNFYKGLEKGKIGLVSAIASPWSIIVVFYSVLILHEQMTLYQLIAFIIILIGTTVASLSFGKESKNKLRFSDPGVIYALLALIGWGTGFIFLNQSIEETGWLSSELVFLALSSLLIFLYILGWRRKKPTFALRDTQVWQVSLLAGLFSTLAYAGYSIGVASYSKVLVAPIAAAYPIATILLSYVFNKERLSKNQSFGAFLVIWGTILLSLQ